MKLDSVRLDSVDPVADQAAGHASARSVLTHPVFLMLVDLAIVLLVYIAAWILRSSVPLPWTRELLPQERWGAVSHPWILIGLTQVFFLYILGLYDDLRNTRYREILVLVFVCCTLQVVTLTSFFYFTNQFYPRTVVLLFDAFNLVALCSWRFYVKSRLRKGVIRVLVVADQPESAQELVRELRESPWMGMRLVGMTVGSEHREDPGPEGCPVLGTLEEIREMVVHHRVEEIVFASRATWKDEVLHSLSKLQTEIPLRISILPSVYEMVIGKLRHINIHDTPLIQLKRTPNEPFERFVKRSFDLLVSLLLLVILLPLFVIVALLIKVLSPGPVFYRQERVGKSGKVFRLYKFRTMVPEAEDGVGEVLAEENDPRVTPLGRLLRRFRIDELPQLFNVFRGDMSFVGPRPERPGFVRQFEVEVSGYSERFKVKPGITGLAQVRGYYHTAVENKLKYDLAYIHNYSFSLDLLLLLETIKVVLIRPGS